MIRTKSWVAGVICLVTGSSVVRGQSPQQTWCGSIAVSENYVSETRKCMAAKLRVAGQLLRPVSLSFHDTPLRQILEDLSHVSGIPIRPDELSFEQAGINLACPLSMKLDKMALKSVLNILCDKLDLSYVLTDGAVRFEVALRACKVPLKQVVYPVAELIVPIENGPRPPVCQLVEMNCKGRTAAEAKKSYENELIALISTIDPCCWRENGGRGTIEYFPLGMALVITQTADVHEQIVDLLAAIRRLQDIEYSQYQLVMRMVEDKQLHLARLPDKTKAYPKITFVREQRVGISLGETFALKEGTVRDLVGPRRELASERHPLRVSA